MGVIPLSCFHTLGGKIENSSVKTFEEIASFCEKESVSVVVVGPEVPLADGLANFLKSRGALCWVWSCSIARDRMM